MSKENNKKRRDPQAPKNVKHLTALLGCQRCDSHWNVVDLNPERKLVTCPVCAEFNDLREATQRGRGGKEFTKEAA
jgi:transcription elongation factor Elf1